LTISPSGEIWIAITAKNIIARLDIAANHFVYYPIPTEGSLPFGVVMGANHMLWFTEAGSNKVGMLKP
jgi:virginiamycin B lyase